MNSLVFNLHQPSAEFVLLGGITVLLTCIVAWLFVLHRRLGRFMQGDNARSLEQLIDGVVRKTSELETFQIELEQYLTKTEERIRKSIQGISIVRFNALSGTGEGGRQSFSIAFLDEKGDGVVLSSMYVRDRFALFGKPIAEGSSEFELTKEETHAIREALSRIRKTPDHQ